MNQSEVDLVEGSETRKNGTLRTLGADPVHDILGGIVIASPA